MPAAVRRAYLMEIYSPSGLNLNLGRCYIGSSDYSRSVYSYDDVPDDMNLDHFSLKHDEAYILPTLREIRDIHPNLFLMATPWSPPDWMKTYGTSFWGRAKGNYLDPYAHSLWELSNGSMKGGWMSEKYLDVYSHYLGKVLQGYAQAGLSVQALSSQKEVATTRMARCRRAVGRRIWNRPSFAIIWARCCARSTKRRRSGCSIITTTFTSGWRGSCRISSCRISSCSDM